MMASHYNSCQLFYFDYCFSPLAPVSEAAVFQVPPMPRHAAGAPRQRHRPFFITTDIIFFDAALPSPLAAAAAFAECRHASH
jgi:hypothetical protein